MSLQQVWPCSLFSTWPFISLKPRLAEPPKPPVLSHPWHRNPLTSTGFWFCVWYWSHHTGYREWNPTPAESVEKGLWLRLRTVGDRLLRPAVQLSAAEDWRLRLSVIKYSRLSLFKHSWAINKSHYCRKWKICLIAAEFMLNIQYSNQKCCGCDEFFQDSPHPK